MEEYIVIIDGHTAIMDGYIVILETTNKDLSGVGMLVKIVLMVEVDI